MRVAVLLFVREDIPCKKIKKNHLPSDIEGIFIELNLHKEKWILFGGYNPKKERASYFLKHLSQSLDKFIGNYDNLLLTGDFNSEIKEENMKDFCDTYNLQNLINEPTCFKSVLNPTTIDLMLTNRARCFQNSVTIETGISDHHKMTITVFKTYFKKIKPMIIKYRNYNKLDIVSFRIELTHTLQVNDSENMNYDKFKNLFLTILNKYAPEKVKIIRGNNGPFMNKTLSKAFMKRSKLKNKYNKFLTEENKSLYNKQRNFCVNLLRKEKRNYYNNLDINIFNDNKKFWQRVRPLFSDKQKSIQKEFILIENDEVITNVNEVAEKMNNFFIETIENLEIEPYPVINEKKDDKNKNCKNMIEDIIKKYERHPSIIKIKEHVTLEYTFSFTLTIDEEIKKEIKQLDPKKATVGNDIPIKMLIETNDIVSNHLTKICNDSKTEQIFPESLKFADVIPIHKKDDRTNKENYLPVSLLPIVSKLLERDMYNQVNSYIEKHLSPYLFGFRKGHSTEQCLNIMLEHWKKALDNKKYVGAVLTDLSKAFDCLNHELLIAKLNAYGFEVSALNHIYNYLSKRNQRTKIMSSNSSWREIKSGVPQGSILGPLLFNIFLNDIFLFVDNTSITNYADDNTPYAIESSIKNLLETLENEISTLLKWFHWNEMKSNNDKCHLLVLNHEGDSIKIGDQQIAGCTSIKLIGITIDNNLNFKEHVTKICKKANQKLHALARIAKYLNTDKLKIIMKSFIESQFNYCPLVWMFHSRMLNNKINKLQERALKIASKNSNLTFQKLLNLDNSYTIYHRNLQKLATEMFKIKNNISPTLMQELFPVHENKYDLRKKRCWETSNVRTTCYGRETLRFRGQKTWQLLPISIKESNSLLEFKSKIRNWRPEGCTCRLCKEFIHDLGFILKQFQFLFYCVSVCVGGRGGGDGGGGGGGGVLEVGRVGGVVYIFQFLFNIFIYF